MNRPAHSHRYDVVTLGESMAVLAPMDGTAIEHARQYRAGIGGAEGNTCIALARLGYRVRWVSRVGQDGFGRMVLSTLAGQGVDVDAVTVDADHPTGVYFRETTVVGGTRALYYRHGSAASFLSPLDLAQGLVPARYLLVTGITPALSASAQQAVYESLKWAHDHGIPVVFDPNVRYRLWPSRSQAQGILVDMAKQADVVVPGLAEGEFLTGQSEPESIAATFLNRGRTQTVVIKLGLAGAFFADRTQRGQVASFSVRSVDPVGAGDAFLAGLLSGLLDGRPLPETVERACALGAIAVSRFGDFEALPLRDELQQFILEQRRGGVPDDR